MKSNDFESINLASSQHQGSSELLEKEVESLETFYQPDKMYHQKQQCKPLEFEQLPGRIRFEEMNPRKSLFLPIHPKSSNKSQISGESILGQSIPTTSFPIMELGNKSSKYPSQLLDNNFLDILKNSSGSQKEHNEGKTFLQQQLAEKIDGINRNNTIYVPLDNSQGYQQGIHEFERSGSTPQFSSSITAPSFSQYEGNCQQCCDHQNEFSITSSTTLQQINNNKKNNMNPADFQHIYDYTDELHQVLQKSLLNEQKEDQKNNEVKESVLKKEQNQFFTDKKEVQYNSSQDNCQVDFFSYATPPKSEVLFPIIFGEENKTKFPFPLQNLQESGLSTFQTTSRQLQQQRNPQQSEVNINWPESSKNKGFSPDQIEQLLDNNLTFQAKQQSQKYIQKQNLNSNDPDENNKNKSFQGRNDELHSKDTKTFHTNNGNEQFKQGITSQEIEDIISNVFKEAKEKFLRANQPKQGCISNNNTNNPQQTSLENNNYRKSDGPAEFDQSYFLTVEKEILNRVKYLESHSSFSFVSPQQQQEVQVGCVISSKTIEQPRLVSEFQVLRKCTPELIEMEECSHTQKDPQLNQLNMPFQIEQDTITNGQRNDDNNNDMLLSMSNYTYFLLEQQKQNEKADYFSPQNYPPCGMVNDSNIVTNEATKGSISMLGQLNNNQIDRNNIISKGVKSHNRNNSSSVHGNSSEFSFLMNNHHSSQSFVLSKSQEKSKEASHSQEKSENRQPQAQEEIEHEILQKYHNNTKNNETNDSIFFQTSSPRLFHQKNNNNQSRKQKQQCHLQPQPPEKSSPCEYYDSLDSQSQNEKDMKYMEFLVSLLEKMKTPKKEILEKLAKLDSMKKSIKDKMKQSVSHVSKTPSCNHNNGNRTSREKHVVFSSNSPSSSIERRMPNTNRQHNSNLTEKNFARKIEQISSNIFTFNANKIQGSMLRPTNSQLKKKNNNQQSADRKRSTSLICSPNQKPSNVQAEKQPQIKVDGNSNNNRRDLEMQYSNREYSQNKNQKSISPNNRSKYHQLNSKLKGKFYDTYEPMMCSSKRVNCQKDQCSNSRNVSGVYELKAQTAQERKYSPNRLNVNPKQTNPFNIPQQFQAPQQKQQEQHQYPYILQCYSLNSQQKQVHFGQQQFNKIEVSKSNNCSPIQKHNKEPFQTMNYPKKQDQTANKQNKNDQDSHSLVLNLKDMQEYAEQMRQNNIQLLKSMEKAQNTVQAKILEDNIKGIPKISQKEQQKLQYNSNKSQEKWRKEHSPIRLNNQFNNNFQNH